MSMIYCKGELSFRWIENCVLTSAPIANNANDTGADIATFKIADAKPYVPIVTLSAEDNVNLQGKVMITQLVVIGFCLFWKKL